MDKLKDLRARAGFTQKELAKKLGTTQQTIARWESGQTAIPIAHLKDIAILFERSIDELVGVERSQQQTKTSPPVQTQHGVPFGTLTANFEFGSRHYPIDEGQRRHLGDAFRTNSGQVAFKGWIDFTALDNSLVLLNTSFVRDLSLVSDDITAMPFFVSPETYRSVTLHTPAGQIAPAIVKERQRLIKHLAGAESDAKRALDKTEIELTRLKMLFANGKERPFYLSYEMASFISSLQNNIKQVESNVFAVAELGSDLHIVNLSKVALIQVPLEAYFNCLTEGVGASAEGAFSSGL